MMLLMLLCVLALLRSPRLLLQACQLEPCHDCVAQCLLCLLDVAGICSCLQARYCGKCDAALVFCILLLVHRQLLLQLLLGSHAARFRMACATASTATAAEKGLPFLNRSATEKAAAGNCPS